VRKRTDHELAWRLQENWPWHPCLIFSHRGSVQNSLVLTIAKDLHASNCQFYNIWKTIISTNKSREFRSIACKTTLPVHGLTQCNEYFFSIKCFCEELIIYKFETGNNYVVFKILILLPHKKNYNILL
jgi:hypothetical protein